MSAKQSASFAPNVSFFFSLHIHLSVLNSQAALNKTQRYIDVHKNDSLFSSSVGID